MLLNPDLLIPYLAVATLMAMSPGPDTMFVIASSASGGSRNGIAAVLGIMSGLLVHIGAAALGISALIAASPIAFDVLRIGGALYLAWIGLQTLHRLLRGNALDAERGAAVSTNLSFRRGLMTNVLNPKVAVFYVALLPQFVDVNLGYVPLQIVVLGVIHDLIGGVWLSGVALASGRAARAFAQSKTMRGWIDGVAGGIYLLLALRILFLERRTA
jgi:threonine/homoserine/homoserine lactone efflux protein